MAEPAPFLDSLDSLEQMFKLKESYCLGPLYFKAPLKSRVGLSVLALFI